jgi:pyrroline-5-carboxylate reductase
MTDPTLPTIGWIGAGRMGAALVRRMLRAIRRENFLDVHHRVSPCGVESMKPFG